MPATTKKTRMHFQTMSLDDVPLGRNGKHGEIVKRILDDLEQLGLSEAVRVPLSNLTAGKEKVRSALNRATRKKGLRVATASDAEFLYVWNEPA